MLNFESTWGHLFKENKQAMHSYSRQLLLRGAFEDREQKRAAAWRTESPSQRRKESPMPQGDKSSYTGKQKRQAAHIEAGYKQKGLSIKNAEARAWATVNKLDGGGKQSGSGRLGEKQPRERDSK
jgi:hypothetical protein